jgi:hypothetical protein
LGSIEDMVVRYEFDFVRIAAVHAQAHLTTASPPSEAIAASDQSQSLAYAARIDCSLRFRAKVSTKPMQGYVTILNEPLERIVIMRISPICAKHGEWTGQQRI